MARSAADRIKLRLLEKKKEVFQQHAKIIIKMTLRIVKSIVKESQFEAILAELNFNYESESDVAMQNFLDFSAWKHAARN